MTRLSFYVRIVLFAIAVTPATQAGAQAQFEVASIKPTQQPGGVRGACHGIDSKYGPEDMKATIPLGRCVIYAGRLSHMIGVAFGVTMDMLQGGPEWVAGGIDRFDLEAKVEDPTKATEAQLLTMLQNLLAERFRMKFHRERRDTDGYALVVARNGHKLKEAGTDEERKLTIGAAGSDSAEAVKRAAAESVDGGSGPPMMLTAQKLPMAELARTLVPFVRGHVVDQTNLTGLYSFKLLWEGGQNLSGPLQNQLGLRLESRKVPVDYFVIESAEKPPNN